MFIDEQRVASGSSRSAGPWACRRPRTTSARRASGRPVGVEDDRLLELIREIHARNYFAYGSWRMWKALLRAGEEVGRGRVERLMRANGIQGAKRRGKPWRTTDPNAAAQRPADLVQRDFTASGPDELWCADFTYLRCWEGVVFFAFVIDVYSRAIVGWQFADHMRTDLVLDALRMALTLRGAGRRRRADPSQRCRQSNTLSNDYSQTLDDHGVLASIGTVGDAYDNAPPRASSTASRPS